MQAFCGKVEFYRRKYRDLFWRILLALFAEMWHICIHVYIYVHALQIHICIYVNIYIYVCLFLCEQLGCRVDLLIDTAET